MRRLLIPILLLAILIAPVAASQESDKIEGIVVYDLWIHHPDEWK